MKLEITPEMLKAANALSEGDRSVSSYEMLSEAIALAIMAQSESAIDLCDHHCKNTAFCPDSHTLTEEGKAERAKAKRPAGEPKCECPCHAGGAPMHSAMGMDCACERPDVAQPPAPVKLPEVTTEWAISLDSVLKAKPDWDEGSVELWSAIAADIRANLAAAQEQDRKRIAELQRKVEEWERLFHAEQRQALKRAEEIRALEEEVARLRAGAEVENPIHSAKE